MQLTVEEMRRAREESANVSYQTFLRHINKESVGLFCFFEGRGDSLYYNLRIKQIWQGNKYYIVCNGKQNVIKVHDLINHHRQYDRYKKAYFVDRDFDEPINVQSIYETPCYSIENFYVSTDVFHEIIENEFMISQLSTDYNFIVSKYENLTRDFNQAVTLVNAWYCCLKDHKKIDGLDIQVNLGESLPNGYINISLDGIEQLYSKETLENDFPNAHKLTQDIIIYKCNYFLTTNKSYSLRGKFIFEFLKIFLREMSEDANKKVRRYFQEKHKNSLNLQNMLSSLSQYAETPDCLIRYLVQVTSN